MNYIRDILKCTKINRAIYLYELDLWIKNQKTCSTLYNHQYIITIMFMYITSMKLNMNIKEIKNVVELKKRT